MRPVVWAWVKGESEDAMREALGAGRGVQTGEVETPAMAAGARQATWHGAEGDEKRATAATGYKTARSAYDYTSHAETQGSFIRPLLFPTIKVFVVR
jgi:hypothetical protein